MTRSGGTFEIKPNLQDWINLPTFQANPMKGCCVIAWPESPQASFLRKLLYDRWHCTPVASFTVDYFILDFIYIYIYIGQAPSGWTLFAENYSRHEQESIIQDLRTPEWCHNGPSYYPPSGVFAFDFITVDQFSLYLTNNVSQQLSQRYPIERTSERMTNNQHNRLAIYYYPSSSKWSSLFVDAFHHDTAFMKLRYLDI